MSRIPFAGRYEGTGRWHDEAGKTQTYSIVQTNTATADGFEIAFRHDFADGTVVEARFSMMSIDPVLVRVTMNGKAAGHGYRFGDFTHYHIAAGAAVVEVGMQVSGDALEIRGSSTTNAEGLFIAWRETLSRV